MSESRQAYFDMPSANQVITNVGTQLKNLMGVYKDNIFYTVGAPLLITDLKRSTGTCTYYRSNIPSDEIHNSFSIDRIQEIKLFKNEDQAFEYAKSLRKKDSAIDFVDKIYQPGVFKVIYPKPQDKIIFTSIDLSTNVSYASSNQQSDFYPRTIPIEYFETFRGSVIPLEGIVKTQGKHLNAIVNLSSTIFYNGEELKEEPAVNQSSECKLF